MVSFEDKIMAYTVKELAKISGVSVRTLHWYDEIGLLKPFSKGVNNYRYYEEQQLLRLQQILFFKELGFALNDIQKLLSQNDFDNIIALNAHRKILEDEIVRKNDLITTIDKTVQHLRGKQAMKDEELYNGFDDNTKQKYDAFLVKFRGTVSEEIIKANEAKSITEADKVRINTENVVIFNAMTKLLESGCDIEADNVQQLIKRHVEILQLCHDVNKEFYLSYAELYSDFSEFRDYFANYNERLADFLSAAMRYYANKNL